MLEMVRTSGDLLRDVCASANTNTYIPTTLNLQKVSIFFLTCDWFVLQKVRGDYIFLPKRDNVPVGKKKKTPFPTNYAVFYIVNSYASSPSLRSSVKLSWTIDLCFLDVTLDT